MSSFNKVILLGNLTRDPELKYTKGGTAVCSFGLATNRKYKKDGEDVEEVCFVDLTAFGRTGEVINEYLKKGRAALFEGRLHFRTWEQDGERKSKLSVVVDTMQLLGGGKQEASKARPATARAQANAAMDADDDFPVPF